MYENRGNGIELYYSYDSFGNLSCIRYHNNGSYNTYYAVCNIRGDVEALYNGTGKRIAKYTYDTWGNTISVVSSTGVEITNESRIGLVNRIRYRGYYWDAETSLYYVSSRYYDPEVGRFINPDTTDVLTATPKALTDKNLYAYCDNNPVVRTDTDGKFWHLVAGGVVGGIIGGVASAISGGDIIDVLIATVAGAASGVLTASGAGVIVQAVVGAGISMTANAVQQTKAIVSDKSGNTRFDVANMLFDVLYLLLVDFGEVMVQVTETQKE